MLDEGGILHYFCTIHMAQNTYKKQNQSSSKSFNFKLDFLNDRKLHLAVGFFLLLTAFFLFISFISYLSTGKADQSVVEAFLHTNIKESGQEAQNWFGSIGAITAHFFIFLWFGLSALLIPPFLFLVGHRIIWKKRIVSLTKAFSFSLFYLLWLSIFIGYFMLSSDEVSEWGFLSGGTGFELAIILDGLMGWGALLFLIFLFLVFNMYFFDITQVPVVDDLVLNLKEKAAGIFRKPEPIANDPEDEYSEDEDEPSDETDNSLDFILKKVKEEVEKEADESQKKKEESEEKADTRTIGRQARAYLNRSAKDVGNFILSYRKTS